MNSKSEGHEFSCPSPKTVLQLLLADLGWPHSHQQSLWCFDLRQTLIPCLPLTTMTCLLWLCSDWCHLLHCGKSQEPYRSGAWRKACGKPLTVCVKGKNIIPSRQSPPGVVDWGHFSELQLCSEMGMCYAQTWTRLAKVWRPRENFQACLHVLQALPTAWPLPVETHISPHPSMVSI